MEKAGELGAKRVTVLHIAPRANRDFRKVTSPRLVDLGDTATEVWSSLIAVPLSFISVATEDLFGRLPRPLPRDLKDWWQFIKERYSFAEDESHVYAPCAMCHGLRLPRKRGNSGLNTERT